MNLLLVDDDEDDQSVFRDALREVDESINLLTAGSGIEALRILTNLSGSLIHIFLDMNMPKLRGIDCLQKMRALSITAPVTIYTTGKLDNDIRECLKLGADYWQKPYSFKEIKRGLKLRLKRFDTAEMRQLIDEGIHSLRRFSKGVDVIIAEVDKDLRYKWIENPHPDFKPHEVIGKRDDELISVEEAKEILAFKERVFKTRSFQSTTLFFDRSDGRKFYNMFGYPVNDLSGETDSIITISFPSHAVEPEKISGVTVL